MDHRTHAPISHHKREDSIGFIRLIRSNRNDETLKRVCQHLSVLIAIENNNSPRPKSRNEHEYSENILYPPNNTPAETTVPYTSTIKMNRGKENWKRISTMIVKKLRVVNALKQYKRTTINATIEPPLVKQTSSIKNINSETSSVITIDQLLTDVLSLSDISKVANFENCGKDEELPKLYKALSIEEGSAPLGKSVWGYFKKSVEPSVPGSQEGPSGAQNVQPKVKRARKRWHVLSRTILTLVRVANILNLLKTSAPPDYSPATSLVSVIFIKRPGNYVDSVSSGSLSMISEKSSILTNSGTDNSSTNTTK